MATVHGRGRGATLCLIPKRFQSILAECLKLAGNGAIDEDVGEPYPHAGRQAWIVLDLEVDVAIGQGRECAGKESLLLR